MSWCQHFYLIAEISFLPFQLPYNSMFHDQWDFVPLSYLTWSEPIKTIFLKHSYRLVTYVQTCQSFWLKNGKFRYLGILIYPSIYLFIQVLYYWTPSTDGRKMNKTWPLLLRCVAQNLEIKNLYHYLSMLGLYLSSLPRHCLIL